MEATIYHVEDYVHSVLQCQSRWLVKCAAPSVRLLDSAKFRMVETYTLNSLSTLGIPPNFGPDRLYSSCCAVYSLPALKL